MGLFKKKIREEDIVSCEECSCLLYRWNAYEVKVGETWDEECLPVNLVNQRPNRIAYYCQTHQPKYEIKIMIHNGNKVRYFVDMGENAKYKEIKNGK